MTLSFVAMCVMNLTLQTFNIYQPIIKFILKVINRLNMHFLDIEIRIKPDETVGRFVHRKHSWNGQLPRFQS